METPFGYTTMHKNYGYFSVERAMHYCEAGIDVICDGDIKVCYGIPAEDEE